MAETVTETAPGKWSVKLRGKWRPRSKIKLALLAAVVLMAGAGGAWTLVQRDKPHGPKVEQPKPAAKALFTTLDLFTVNLQDPYSERIAQIGVTLQYEDPAVEVAIKDRLPAVRNAILLLISSKQVDELLTVEGKEKLAQEIRRRAGRAIGDDTPEVVASPAASVPASAAASVPASAGASAPPKSENLIRAVLFSHFIVQ